MLTSLRKNYKNKLEESKLGIEAPHNQQARYVKCSKCGNLSPVTVFRRTTNFSHETVILKGLHPELYPIATHVGAAIAKSIHGGYSDDVKVGKKLTPCQVTKKSILYIFGEGTRKLRNFHYNKNATTFTSDR